MTRFFLSVTKILSLVQSKKNRNENDSFFAEIINLSSHFDALLFTSGWQHISIINSCSNLGIGRCLLFAAHCRLAENLYRHFAADRAAFDKTSKIHIFPKNESIDLKLQICRRIDVL